MKENIYYQYCESYRLKDGTPVIEAVGYRYSTLGEALSKKYEYNSSSYIGKYKVEEDGLSTWLQDYDKNGIPIDTFKKL